MSLIVLDASVTTGWLLEDERGNYALSVRNAVRQDGASVPQHWRFEVANSLLVAERRGRLRGNEARQRLHNLDDLAIEIDASPNLDETLRLAFEHELTFYDALYLELALRLLLPLATLDNDLALAAGEAGVEVHHG